MDFSGFDWDAGNRVKCQKHGVSLGEIEFVLRSDPLIIPDVQHSLVEQRFHGVGQVGSGRVIFIVFTLRVRQEGSFIRPISARYMHAKEIARYEKTKTVSGFDE